MLNTQLNLDVKSVNNYSPATLLGEPDLAVKPITAIRNATIAEQHRIIASIVLAFSSDVTVRWMYPESYQYLTHFPRFVQAFGGKAFAHKTAYCIGGYLGAALQFPPGAAPDADPVVELLRQTVSEPEQADVFSVLEQLDHYHPEEPHWYLPIIGVDPNQQGKGYGSALMRHVLVQCDRDRTSAYLESSNPANISFYERHGFEVLDTVQVGTSPPIFPMVRLPQ